MHKQKNVASFIYNREPIGSSPCLLESAKDDNPVIDLGEQTALIARLTQRLAHYEDALQQCGEGICVFDRDGDIRFVNRRFIQIYALNQAQFDRCKTLEDILGCQILAGLCVSNSVMEYLHWLQSPEAVHSEQPRFIDMKNGGQVRIKHVFYPDGSCVSLHKEKGTFRLNDPDAEDQLSLQHLIDAMPDYMWVKDVKSQFKILNKALALDLGQEDTKDVLGKSDKDFHSPRRAKAFRATEMEIMRTGVPVIDQEEMVIGRNGAEKWFSSTKIPLHNKEGSVVGLAGVSRDITKRKSAEVFIAGQAKVLELIATSNDLKTALDALINLIEMQIPGVFGSIMLTDTEKPELYFFSGPRFSYDMFDTDLRIPIAENTGSCGTAAFIKDIIVVADIEKDERWRDYRHLVAAFGFKSWWSAPIFDVAENVVGTFAFYSTESRTPTDEERETVALAARIAGIAIDSKQTKQRVDYLTTHDELTKLRNRATFKEILEQTIRYANRQKNRFSIVYINIDGFKLINDSLGHQTGDNLLIEVSKRLLASVRASDHVIRIGGDEFVIVLLDQPQAEHASLNVFEKIKNCLSEPITVDTMNIGITSSIGIAYYPEDGSDAGTILANAGAAMHRAKEVGRDNFQFYTHSMNTMLREKFDLQTDLREAIGTDQIYVNYQPQIDLRTGRVFAAEALLRWNHPKLGPVSPGKFIPVAEQSGLIQAIGNWVLREACLQNKRWQDAGQSPITVCVNVSARQFKNRNIIENTLIALSESGLDPKYLELEITESLIMQDIEQSIAIMNELKLMGIKIAIDDFGTGYSSLSALKTFPVARLKIDKSFVNDIAVNVRDKAVTSAVISLGQKLNLRVIAEGVETEAQLRILKENDCDEIQGYHFSKPLSADAFAKFVTDSNQATY